ncbi:MAG: hypothetical protein LH615_06260, partial [Ferruginibacter sp.]|nr:hypothetical protein [Ferruginibacter sp.]
MKHKRILKVFIQLVFILTRINWIGFFKYYKRKSPNVVLLSFLAGKFGIELVCWDFAYINFFISHKISFSTKKNIQ